MTPERIIELRDTLATCEEVHRRWTWRYEQASAAKLHRNDISRYTILMAHERRSLRRINRYQRLLGRFNIPYVGKV
jgi:hypothetical protein